MENHPKRLGVLLSFLQKILVILGLGFWFPFSKKMENHPKRRLPSLTDDLIHEILVRLPAKSISRFRCVSKRWLSDLTDPKFIRAHSSRSPTSGFFLFTSPFDPFDRAEHIPFDSESRLPDPTLSFLDNDGLPPQFFDCCNGLILCGKPYCRPWKGDGIYVLAVCNPLTRACHFIPVAYSVFSISREAFLAFDPSVSPHFKVVSVRGGFTLIYSSETRKWKLLTTEYYNTRFIRSSVWSGNLVLSSFNDSPLCLDMRREQLEWLPRLPGPVNGKELWRRYLGESGGRLHFIVPITDESVTHFDIWELMPGSTEWSVLYKINIEHIKDMYPEVKPYGEDQPDLTPAVVHFSRDEGGLGDRLLLSVPGKIVCYHLRDKSFTTVCNAVPVYSTGFARSQLSFYPLAHTLSPFYDSENAPTTSLKDGISWPTDWDIVTRSGR